MVGWAWDLRMPFCAQRLVARLPFDILPTEWLASRFRAQRPHRARAGAAGSVATRLRRSGPRRRRASRTRVLPSRYSADTCLSPSLLASKAPRRPIPGTARGGLPGHIFWGEGGGWRATAAPFLDGQAPGNFSESISNDFPGRVARLGGWGGAARGYLRILAVEAGGQTVPAPRWLPQRGRGPVGPVPGVGLRESLTARGALTSALGSTGRMRPKVALDSRVPH